MLRSVFPWLIGIRGGRVSKDPKYLILCEVRGERARILADAFISVGACGPFSCWYQRRSQKVKFLALNPEAAIDYLDILNSITTQLDAPCSSSR